MFKKAWLLIALLAIGLQGCANRTDPNNPKMPYDYWGFEAIYPHYMEIETKHAFIVTQNNKLYGSPVPTIEDEDAEGKWDDYPGGSTMGISKYMDLPKRIGICWLSYLDKKTYWAEFNIPLSARQMMVEPITIVTPIIERERKAYRYKIWLGIAPDASITVWLGGVALPRGNPVAPIIAKAQGREMINNPNCNSGYNDPNDIPDISDEGKAWIKANGLPTSW